MGNLISTCHDFEYRKNRKRIQRGEKYENKQKFQKHNRNFRKLAQSQLEKHKDYYDNRRFLSLSPDLTDVIMPYQIPSLNFPE